MTYGDRWNRSPDGGWRDDDREDVRSGHRAHGRGRQAHPDHPEHDKGYEPWGATGRTYYGEPGRREARTQGYDEGRYGSHGSYGSYGYDRGRDYGFGETGGGYSRYDRDHEWGSNPRSGRGDEARTWFDKASDQVQSWFGDDDAQRRRRWDEMRAGEHRGRGPKGYRRSDERIREDVSDRLTDDDWLDASGIEVSVKDTEVTLNGAVATRDDKRRAELLAERCSGVDHVQNNLRVQRTGYDTTAATGADATGGTDSRVTSSSTGRA